MRMLTVSQTAEFLQTVDHVLILTHVRPDGDTVGCAAALCAGLRALGKTAYLLPNPELTRNTAPYFRPYEAPEGFVPETVVSTDIATVGLFPENAKPYAGRVDLAIDHHPSFEHFGRANIVRPEAAACGELIYDILAALGPITPEMALPLYVARVHGHRLLCLRQYHPPHPRGGGGADARWHRLPTVNKVFFRTKSRKQMQLEGAMLNDCEFYDRDRVAVLSGAPFPDGAHRRHESDAEDLSALGPQIEGVDCAITMRELRPDVWKMSLRTGPRINATRGLPGCWAAAATRRPPAARWKPPLG